MVWLYRLLAVGYAVATVYFLIHGDAMGVVMAVGSPAVVTGTRARASLSTNREDSEFETGIALLDPNENPATLAVMEMGKDSSGTIDFNYFEDELVPEVNTINYGAGYDASSTAIDVDNGEYFAVGDLAMHNTSREVMLVTAVTDDILTVVRDYGAAEGWTEYDGAPADGEYLTVIGNAFEQGHPLPVIRSTTEVQYTNYAQDQRTPFGISEVSAASAHRGEQDEAFQRRKAGISHSRKLEYQNFWGRPYVGDKGLFVAATGNTLPTTGGGWNHYISEYAPTAQKLDETEITSDEFQNFMESVFEYGSGMKFCYCPPKLRTGLDKWGISKLNTFVPDTMFGMAVNKWISSHGTVVFITHKMLKNPQSGDWLYSFFIDMEKVKWITFSNIGSTRLRRLEPYKATGATVKQEEYQTIGCTKVGLPPTHARLRFKTIGA